MEITTIDQTTGEILDVMTEDEAREKTAKIKDNLKDCRLLAWEIYEREGWKALNYNSMTEWAEEELEVKPSWVSRNIAACRVEKLLGWPLGAKPEGQLRPLSTLLPTLENPTPDRLKDAASRIPNLNNFTGTEAECATNEVIAEMNEEAAKEWFHSMDSLISEMEDWNEDSAFGIIQEIDRAKKDYRAIYANELDRKHRHKLAQVANVEQSDLSSAWGGNEQPTNYRSVRAKVYKNGDGTLNLTFWRNDENGSKPHKGLTAWKTGLPEVDSKILYAFNAAADAVDAIRGEDKSE